MTRPMVEHSMPSTVEPYISGLVITAYTQIIVVRRTDTEQPLWEFKFLELQDEPGVLNCVHLRQSFSVRAIIYAKG